METQTQPRFEQLLEATQREYVPAEAPDTSFRMEQDDVDWCAWWAEYGELME
jgi:hypothetical protein